MFNCLLPKENIVLGSNYHNNISYTTGLSFTVEYLDHLKQL